MAPWKTKPLGEVCAIARGGSPRPIQAFLTDADDGINWVKISDATASGKYIYSTAEKIKPAGASRSRVVNDGDFLLSNSMSFGRPYIMRTSGCVHDGWLVLSRYEDSFNQDFLYHLLGSPQVFTQFDLLAAGSTVRNLNIELARRVVVPIPPASEQRRIVVILDEAFEGIATAKANAEKNLKNARGLVDALGETCFDQHTDDRFFPRPLSDLCELIVDCEHKTAPTQEHGYPSIRTPNIGKGRLILDEVNRVSEETYVAWTRRAIPMPGDLILAREAPAGNVAVVPDGIQVCLGQRTVLLRPRREVFEPEYLARLLLQRGSQRRLLAHSRGATVQHINMKDIRAFMIEAVPSLEVQRQVIKMLAKVNDACELLEATQRQKIAALDELKKSLLHQAFTGQLTSTQPKRVALQLVLQTTTPEFAANVISIAYARHERQQREKTFGRVKEQKVLHLTESIAKIDMGRQPMRDAAGPNDFQHMLKAEEWARGRNFFEMVKREGGYDFKKLSAFDEHLSRAHEALAPHLPQLESVIDILVPMDKKEVEVFATVHAAWNNLLIDGAEVTDGAIVSAAREGWHADKLDIPKGKFQDAIALIRQKGVVPDGTAKYVGGQQPLL